MKVFIDFNPDDTGRGNFARRLVNALKELGVKCNYGKNNCDIALGFTTWKTETKIPKVLRLDGILFYEQKKYLNKIKSIKKSIKSSDYIIYQSEFSKRILNEIYPNSKPSVIIHNGAKIIRPRIHRGYNIFVVYQYIYNRTPEKRSQELIGALTEYAVNNRSVNICIFGHNYGLRETVSNMKYYGLIKNMEKYLPSADVVVNAAYFDWCPNSVVEAICSGVPVICYGGHGTEEIVGNNGIIIKQPPITLDVLKTNIIPPIKRKDIFDALDTIRDNKINVCCPDLSIENVARKYVKTFEKILNTST